MCKMGTVYLDYNATTPLEPDVLSSIHTALEVAWGNPSSAHDAGKKAKVIIDRARQDVAKMIGAKPSDIVFTSGGTEANNMIIQTCVEHFHISGCYGYASNGSGDQAGDIPHIISSRIEHPAVNVMLDQLEQTRKAEVTYVPVSRETGCVEVDGVLAAVRPNTILVTVMLSNNETGLIQPVEAISKAVKSLIRGKGETPRIFVHTDTAQAIGKIPVNSGDMSVDYLTVVGHKFYGPRIGAIFARDLANSGVPLYPMFFGGGQERNFRPGTENTGMIAGLGKACSLVTDNLEQYETQMQTCRDYLEEKLEEAFPAAVHFNGRLKNSRRLPNTCNVSLCGEGLEGHNVLSRCKRLQASVGAACHEQNRPSAILLALGIPEGVARNALRLSLGRHTTKEDIDVVIEDLKQAVNSLKSDIKA